MEIIEYLEELVDLAKLLVGVNAFRSGMLERPKFHEYAKKFKERESDRSAAAAAAAAAAATEAQAAEEVRKVKSKSGGSFVRRRRGFTLGKTPSHATDTSVAGGSGSGSGSRGGGGGEGFGLRRMFTGASRGDEVAVGSSDDDNERNDKVEDLPMSLQRVMTKRMEDRQRGRRGSRGSRGRRDSDDPKGKGPAVRPARTWAP